MACSKEVLFVIAILLLASASKVMAETISLENLNNRKHNGEIPIRVMDNLSDDRDIIKDLIQMIFQLNTMKNKKQERPVKVPWKYFPIWKYPHLIASLTSGLNDASNSPSSPAEN